MPQPRSAALRVLFGLLVVLLSVGSVAPARADKVYPLPTRGHGTVSSTTVHQGECVTFSGSGFAPNTPITLTDNDVVVGHTTSNSAGEFSARICFSTTATLGKHTLRATGVGANGAAREVFANVTVLGVRHTRSAQGGGGGGDVNRPFVASQSVHGGGGGGVGFNFGLPFTGSDIAAMVGLGVLLTLLGFLLVRRGTRPRGQRRIARAAD